MIKIKQRHYICRNLFKKGKHPIKEHQK